jgi:hypothetical protein
MTQQHLSHRAPAAAPGRVAQAREVVSDVVIVTVFMWAPPLVLGLVAWAGRLLTGAQ